MSAYSPDGEYLYVVNAKAATISVVEEHFREVVGVLPGEKDMRAFVPTRDWMHAWVSASAADKVFLLDLATGERVATIDMPGEPHGIVLSPDDTLVYVVQRRAEQIAVIDAGSRKIVKTAPMGKRPDQITISPDGTTLYVGSRNENKVLIVSASDLRVIGEVATGKDPHGLAYRN
jgi:YVTN family beta-propeller protein